MRNLLILALVVAGCSGKTLETTDAAVGAGEGGATGWDGGYVDDTGLGSGDSAALAETSTPGDGGFPLPAACGNPGPFSGQISSAVVGMWIYCNHSLFGDFGATNDVGVVFRANGTWQRLGASGDNLHYLGLYVDYGTWSTYGNGMVMVNVNGGGLAIGPEISSDGNTMYVTSPSAADKTFLAKVVDSVSGDAEPPLGVPEGGGGDGGVD
jgi:hypothetical protein